MVEPVNHHYVPVFYLRQWCADDGKIVRYFRPNKEVVAKSIAPKNTGYEPHLYALEGFPADQKQSVEKHYMAPVVDDPASKALQILLASKLDKMTVERKVDWTRFLMSLPLRGPDAVAQANADMRREMTTRLLDNAEWYDAFKQSGDPVTFVEWVERHVPSILQSSGTLHLPNFIDHEGIGTHLLRMRWFTFDLGGSGRTLLTGDQPFIRTHGLKDPRCIVLLPLSPRFVFVATNAERTDRRLTSTRPEVLVKDINARIVMQAKRYVYGSTAEHLRFVENRLTPAK